MEADPAARHVELPLQNDLVVESAGIRLDQLFVGLHVHLLLEELEVTLLLGVHIGARSGSE